MHSRWLIIADDLTGAADCAIAFGKRGIESVVAWERHAQAGQTQVLAVDAASRQLTAPQAAQRQLEVLAAHYRPGLRLYKKIDSTLRGQPAAELAALLAFPPARRAGRSRLAIVAPAFPATGRITVNGSVLLGGVPLEQTPLWARDHTYASAKLPGILGSAGLSAEIIPLEVVSQGAGAIEVRLQSALRRGTAAVVCDASSEAHLAALAAASFAMAEDVIWVGSAGLAASLAALEAPGEEFSSPQAGITWPAGAAKNILVVVGSLAEASRLQTKTIIEAGPVERVPISPATLFAGPCAPAWQAGAQRLAELLAAGKDVLLELEQEAHPDLSRGAAMADRLAEFAANAVSFPQQSRLPFGALVATGGDTLYALLSRFDVHGIRLLEEVEPGVPLGITLGAITIPLVSKAGAFGDAHTLRRSLERLRRAEDMSMSRPIVVITMGDPAGIGPEVIMKSLAHAELYQRCRPLVSGDAERLRQAGRIVGVKLAVNPVRSPADGKYQAGTVDVIDLAVVPRDLPFGKVSAAGGEAAFRFIEKAAQLVTAGEADAICTAPLNKEALHAAGHKFPGHTELLAHLTGTPEVSMMLVTPKLRVIHVTTHTGLLDAIAKINPGLVERTIARAHDTLVKAGIGNPRIGVCAINPHAGEHGLFGHGEEEQKIEPAIRACVKRGWRVEGPLPADTLFFRASRGDFDCVVAMYHDQGHGPVKVLGIEAGVNITVGLPVVRTSVDHGTAFDIAGTGKADERSLLEALRQAIELAPKQRPEPAKT